jgi:hypothetical protein
MTDHPPPPSQRSGQTARSKKRKKQPSADPAANNPIVSVMPMTKARKLGDAAWGWGKLKNESSF